MPRQKKIVGVGKGFERNRTQGGLRDAERNRAQGISNVRKQSNAQRMQNRPHTSENIRVPQKVEDRNYTERVLRDAFKRKKK